MHRQEADEADTADITDHDESGSPVCGTETRCRTETVSVQRNRGGQTTVCSSEAISDGDRIERCSGVTEDDGCHGHDSRRGVTGEYGQAVPQSFVSAVREAGRTGNVQSARGTHRKEGSAPNRKNDCAGEQLSRCTPDYPKICKLNYPGY